MVAMEWVPALGHSLHTKISWISFFGNRLFPTVLPLRLVRILMSQGASMRDIRTKIVPIYLMAFTIAVVSVKGRM